VGKQNEKIEREGNGMGMYLWFVGVAVIVGSLFEKQVGEQIFSVGLGLSVCIAGAAREITMDLTAEIKKLEERCR
jgi:hypothetical protein